MPNNQECPICLDESPSEFRYLHGRHGVCARCFISMLVNRITTCPLCRISCLDNMRVLVEDTLRTAIRNRREGRLAPHEHVDPNRTGGGRFRYTFGAYLNILPSQSPEVATELLRLFIQNRGNVCEGCRLPGNMCSLNRDNFQTYFQNGRCPICSTRTCRLEGSCWSGAVRLMLLHWTAAYNGMERFVTTIHR